MIKITYIEPNGHAVTVSVPPGWTLMQAATANGVDGMDAECGGSCACATCHCYVDETSLGKLPAPSDIEVALLENVAAERKDGSRLACQLVIKPELDGIVVHLPDRQS